MAGSDSLLFAQLAVSGTYTLISTTATAPSHAPPGQQYTAFTAALLGALSQPQPLTLDGIYQYIDRELHEQGLPRPQRRSVNAAGDLALVRRAVAERGCLRSPASRSPGSTTSHPHCQATTWPLCSLAMASVSPR
jgi:hypothetical protein